MMGILGAPGEVLEEVGPVSGRPVKTTAQNFLNIPDMVGFLRGVVDDWRGRAWTREQAVDIVFRKAGCKPKDRLCHALAIGEWVQKNIIYVNEIPETFQTPKRTVELGAGDCDDFTTLIASFAEAVGIPATICAMKINGSWKHVFPILEIRRPGKPPLRVVVDATLNQPVRLFTNPIKIALERGDQVETIRA